MEKGSWGEAFKSAFKINYWHVLVVNTNSLLVREKLETEFDETDHYY